VLLTGIRPTAVRFTFSPLQEVLRALGVFADPRRHAEQMEWLRGARRRATPALKREIARFAFLLSPVPELFPELFPAAEAVSETVATLEDELRLLRGNAAAFDAAMARRMLGTPLVRRDDIEAASKPAALRRLARAAAARQRDGSVLHAFANSPSRARRELCDLLASFYERCLAREWDGYEARALADARGRARLMERFGITAMLRTLTRRATATGGQDEAALAFGGAEAARTRLVFDAGATLSLTPSAFIWPGATFVVLRGERLDVRIAYPLASPATIRPRAAAWTDAARRFAALGDPLRLDIMELLRDRALSTRELAGFTGLSESGVSRHLAILRDAGMVSSQRDGYFVLYRRTADADVLLRAATEPAPRMQPSASARPASSA